MRKTAQPAIAREKAKWDVGLFFLLLLALAVMLLRKCRYGFGNIDEAFYLTIPLRLLQGDHLLLHEWHLSQLSGFLLKPFLRLFLLFSGGTEGILLAFRRIYTCVQLLAAIPVFFLLRKESKPGALCGALLWCVYAPFSIMALSYNSMGILCVTLSMLLHFRCERAWGVVLSGFLFACAVLCCPFLILVWAAYALQMALRKLFRAGALPAPRKFWCFTLGAGLMAAIFLVSLFRGLSPRRLAEVLPLILHDPEHGFAPVYKFKVFVSSLLFCGKYGCCFFVGYCILTLVGALSRKSPVNTLCVMGVFLLCVLHLLATIQVFHYFNHLMLPFSYAACACGLIRRDESQRPLFFGLFLPCLLYIPCLQLSSNQGLFAMSSAAAAAMPASLVIMLRSLRGEELPGLRAAAAGCLACLLLLQGGSELYYRWDNVFWEGSVAEQTVLLREGPEAGLLVKPVKAALYEPHLEELRSLNSREKVLFLSERTWYYLCGDWQNASFSAWLSGVNSNSVQKLLRYYAINEDKLPDLIYADKEALPYIQPFIREYGFHVDRSTALGSILLRR